MKFGFVLPKGDARVAAELAHRAEQIEKELATEGGEDKERVTFVFLAIEFRCDNASPHAGDKALNEIVVIYCDCLSRHGGIPETKTKIKLETGRHHQIRSQLSSHGYPIKGDLKYGSRRSNKDGSIHLHARKIAFEHPVKKTPLEIIAPLPPDPLWDLCPTG